MDTRLAHQFALIAALVVCGRGLWDGRVLGETIENALLWGLFGWGLGAVVATIVTRLAIEHVAVIAGQAAEAADENTISEDRIPAP